MTHKLHTEHRQAMEDLLSERADRALALLRQRAKDTGMNPRTLLKQIAPPSEKKPAGSTEYDHIVRRLLKRLAGEGDE